MTEPIPNSLFDNLDKIHTTPLGAERIRKNLELGNVDVVLWCKQKIKAANCTMRKGKNWYVNINDVAITINAHSFTIITAHKDKNI